MGSKVKKIDITEMNMFQLATVKQQLDNEIEVLESSIQNLQNAKIKFQESGNAVEKQKHVSDGTQILVPITGSMYVPGFVTDNDVFMVDIGTGYFVEKNRKSAADYFKRKVQFLSEQIDKYVKVIQEKVNARESICEMLQLRQQQTALANQQIAGSSQSQPQKT